MNRAFAARYFQGFLFVASVLSIFCKLFYFMNEEGILDPQNQIHLAALLYVYLKLINKSFNV